MVANGDMDIRKANAIICGCNTLLGSIQSDKQHKQLDELKTIVEEPE